MYTVRFTPLIRLAVAACILVLAVGAADGSAERSAGATARAWAIKVIVPGQLAAGTKALAAPDDAVVVRRRVRVSGRRLDRRGDVRDDERVGFERRAGFRRRVVAGHVALALQGRDHRGDRHRRGACAREHCERVRRRRRHRSRRRSWCSASRSYPTANQQIPLGDWGYAIALEQKSQRVDTPTPGYHDFVTALDVFLTADHGGLPAGSELQIGYAEANAQASEAAPLPTPPSTPTITTGKTGKAAGRPRPERSTADAQASRRTCTPKLTAGGYVFPVYGNSSFIDTFGAFRGDVSGGWHHGDDIFARARRAAARRRRTAPCSPSAGTRSAAGGSGYATTRATSSTTRISPRTRRSRSTARSCTPATCSVSSATRATPQGTPYHLHFEVHPVGLLGLGYDGAVDPTSYLLGWERLKDVRFDAVARLDARVARRQCAEGRRDPAAVVRHLERERARPGVDRPCAVVRRRRATEGCCSRRRSNPPRSRS